MITVGTPGMARDKELDAARIRDLREISWAIQRFAREEGHLPKSLQELDLDPETLVDPVSKEAYGYTVKDSKSYQLSAEFALADDERGRFYEDDWRHPSGMHYFDLKVTPDPGQT
jgi:hypothetical protein